MGILFRIPIGASSPHWLSTLSDTGNNWAYGVTVDSSGYTYVCGTTDTSGVGPRTLLLAKYSPLGAIVWQESLVQSGVDTEGMRIAVGSTGDVYGCGFNNNLGSEMLIFKCSPSGSVVWSKTVTGTQITPESIATDASDNVYVAYSASVTGGEAGIMKLSSSGTLVWQRSIGLTLTDTASGIATDGTNVYVVGYTNNQGAGSDDVLVVKLDSSGTVAWQRILGSTADDRALGVAIDSTGNVYVCGDAAPDGFAGNHAMLVKYNSSGTVVWQRVIYNPDGITARALDIDSSDDVYVVGYAGGAVAVSGFIAKFAATGSVLWQRTLTGTAPNNSEWYTLDIRGTDVHVTGYVDIPLGLGTTGAITLKVPTDGSKTGTYGGYTYQASSFVIQTPTLTDATSTLTVATSSYVLSNVTLTPTTTTLTTSTTVI